ncbi:ATP-dependent Clp protease ATP-binding subunit ClpX [Vallitalea guaymasensis]|uniref:ATP-dependent Clp protease ATP-binding subunit ClpX n=1 Tax=Vallitalea guaymasensis TaxID=1185412 RepID=UPI000DE2BC81|nr:ATP-dependent Clp protease ATP-binding subunit ClpX [Vallitalea guaymasensis]
MKTNKIPRCNSCNGKKDENRKLCVIGDGIYICSNCIDLLHNELHKDEISTLKKCDTAHNKFNIKTPSQIKAILDEHVIGQYEAKKVLAVAAYNHYKRINDTQIQLDDVVIEKSNILMIGPTGSGKTLLASTLAHALDVPFISVDATSYTSNGYIGKDVEDIIVSLYLSTNNDINQTEKGIIFIDEIDKITKKSTTNNLDVTGEAVQNVLLKLLEGDTIEIPKPNSDNSIKKETISINTKNILFICGGAFSGIEEYHNDDHKHHRYKNITSHDLFKYGFKHEFIGRLPMVTTLEKLNKEDLIEILIKPKNSIIKQYKKLLSMDNVELEFSKEAMELIADKALQRGIGARALRSIIDDLMIDIMYNAPDNNYGEKLIISEEDVLVNNPTV